MQHMAHSSISTLTLLQSLYLFTTVVRSIQFALFQHEEIFCINQPSYTHQCEISSIYQDPYSGIQFAQAQIIFFNFIQHKLRKFSGCGECENIVTYLKTKRDT
jgi:hypothetical protein